jgi:protein-tyrosine phosphatase
MTGSVLFVCAANVCRSPLMRFTFLASTARDDWSAASAGISARPGAAMCDLARSMVRDPAAAALAAAHRSASVDEAFAAPGPAPDLVIVASRAERAALATRDPDLRARLFTLSEAVLLGRIVAAQRADGSASDTSPGAYARRLDAQRGMLVFPRPPRRRPLGGASAGHPLDIPDDHHRRRGPHTATLKRVRAETEELAAQVQAFAHEG